jgi:hypothetical protein
MKKFLNIHLNKKFFVALIFLFFIYFGITGISIPFLASTIEHKIQPYIPQDFQSVTIQKILFKFPNKLVVKKIKFLNKNKKFYFDEIGEISVSFDILNFFNIIKNKKFEFKNISKISIKNISFNIIKTAKKVDEQTLIKEIFETYLDSINKINYLPVLELKNLKFIVGNVFDGNRQIIELKNTKIETNKTKNSKYKTVVIKSYFDFGEIRLNFFTKTRNLKIQILPNSFLDLAKFRTSLLFFCELFDVKTNSIPDFDGKIFPDITLKFNLFAILFPVEKNKLDFSKITLNGKFVLEQFYCDIHNDKIKLPYLNTEIISINNMQFSADFSDNAYSLEKGFALVNNIPLNFSITSSNYLKKPDKISLYLDNFDVRKLNFMDINKKLDDIKLTMQPLSVRLNLTKKITDSNEKYTGKIDVGFLSAGIADALVFRIDPFFIDIFDDSFALNDLNINIKNIGEMTANCFFSAYKTSLKIKSNNYLFLDKIRDNKTTKIKTIADRLKLKNFNFEFEKDTTVSSQTVVSTKLFLATDIESNGIDVNFSVNKNLDLLNFVLKDNKTNANLLNFDGSILDNKVEFKNIYIDGDKNRKINISGYLPIGKNEKIDLKLNAKKLSSNLLKKFFNRSDLLVDFETKLDDRLDNILIKNKFLIYAKNLSLDSECEFRNKIFNIQKLTLNKQANVIGFYDFSNKNFDFKMNFNKFQLINILELFQKFSKIKLEKALMTGSLNLANKNDSFDIFSDLDVSTSKALENISLKLKLDSSKNIYNLDIFQANENKGFFSIINAQNFKLDKLANLQKCEIKGYLKNFVYNQKTYSGDFSNKLEFLKDIKKAEKNSGIIGNLNINNLLLDKLKLSKIKIFYEYDFKNNIFAIQNFFIDNVVSGNAKCSFDLAKNNQISGQIKFENFDILNIFTTLKPEYSLAVSSSAQPTNMKEFLLDGTVSIAGSLNKPQITSQDMSFHFEKNQKKYLFKNELFFKDDKFFIKKGVVFIDSKENLDYSGSFSTKKNAKQLDVVFDLKDLDSNEINFLANKQICKGFISGKILATYLDDDKKLNINSHLNYKNGELFVFYVDNSEIDLTYNFTDNSVYIRKFFISEKTNELVLKENSVFKKNKTGNFDFNLNFYLKNWDVFSLFRGLGDFKAEGEIKQNEIDGKIIFESLWANKYSLRNKNLKFNYSNDILKLSATENNAGLNANLVFKDGNIKLDKITYKDAKSSFLVQGLITKNHDLNIQGKGTQFEAEIITKFIPIGFYIEGPTDFKIEATGSFKNPKIDINLNSNHGKFAVLNFDKLTSDISIRKDGIKIENFNILKNEKYNIFCDGLIPYPVVSSEKEQVLKKKMSLNIKSPNSNLGILEEIIGNSILKPKGNVDINLNIGNTIFEPQYNGYINVSKASFGLKDGLKSFKDFNAEIVFKNNQIEIKNTSAKVGQGLLSIGGFFNLKNFGFEDFDLKAQVHSATGISLELNSLKIPQSSIIKLMPESPSKGEIKGNLQIKGTPEKYLLKGDLLLENANFTYPPKNTENSDSSIAGILKNADFDVRLKSGGNNWFQNELVNIVVDGNFSFTGPIEKFNVNGDVEFLRGDISYLGIYFKILEGKFSLINNESFLGLKAETSIQRKDATFNKMVDDKIILTVDRAKLKDIKLKFESLNYPGTSAQEAMGLAVSGGASSSMSSVDKENYLKQEFFRLVDNTLTTPLVKMFVQSTGLVDFVKINANVAQKGLDNNQTVSNNSTANLFTGSNIVVGKYLNPNLFVSYSLGLEANGTQDNNDKLDLQHEIEAKVKLHKNFSLQGLVQIDKATNREDKQVTVEYAMPFFNKNKKKEPVQNKETETKNKQSLNEFLANTNQSQSK